MNNDRKSQYRQRDGQRKLLQQHLMGVDVLVYMRAYLVYPLVKSTRSMKLNNVVDVVDVERVQETSTVYRVWKISWKVKEFQDMQVERRTSC